jgi:hypothetical protein
METCDITWNDFNKDKIFKTFINHYNQCYMDSYFWKDLWNVAYFGGDSLNKYLHNKIKQNLVRS